MAVYIRLVNGVDKNSNVVVVRSKEHGDYVQQLIIRWHGTMAAASTELGGANAVILAETTTPVILRLVSASANDDSGAADHVQKVSVIGITVESLGKYVAGLEDPCLTIEELTLNGVTPLSTTLYYLRAIHMYSSSWGSGGSDAAGNIILSDDDVPTNTYHTIAAAANESTGCKIYVPKNYRAHLQKLLAYPTSGARTDGLLLIIEYKGWMNQNNQPDNDPDFPALYYASFVAGGSPVVQMAEFGGSKDAYFQPKENWLGSEETGNFEIIVQLTNSDLL